MSYRQSYDVTNFDIGEELLSEVESLIERGYREEISDDWIGAGAENEDQALIIRLYDCLVKNSQHRPWIRKIPDMRRCRMEMATIAAICKLLKAAIPSLEFVPQLISEQIEFMIRYNDVNDAREADQLMREAGIMFVMEVGG